MLCLRAGRGWQTLALQPAHLLAVTLAALFTAAFAARTFSNSTIASAWMAAGRINKCLAPYNMDHWVIQHVQCIPGATYLVSGPQVVPRSCSKGYATPAGRSTHTGCDVQISRQHVPG